MEENISSLSDLQLKIGDIFTPGEWACFAIQQGNLFERWMNGASIFDPTMGTGQLLEAFIQTGLNKGYTTAEMPIYQLFGNELNQEYYNRALERFSQDFGVDMTRNFSNEDLFKIATRPFDIILGNPPWQNFNNLPPLYKEKIKPWFAHYGLIKNPRNLLLGGSRIDIAALVIRKALHDFLAHKGEAWFFMPLSLMLNDGAHESFRNYQVGEISYSPVTIYDFHKTKVFSKVATRYGLIHFQRDQEPAFPIPYHILKKETWETFQAAPVHQASAPLSIYRPNQPPPLRDYQCIRTRRYSTPRQGINTSGANEVFFFKTYERISDTTCVVNGETKLPLRFVYPLLMNANFKSEDHPPKAWVLIPHNAEGRPLSEEELGEYPDLKAYLRRHYEKLNNRKGTLINSWLKKGIWWALLGVGPYNFAPFKIVWEAYGKKEFNPLLVEGQWQANQSLQAFMPFSDREEAAKILKKLQDPVIEEYLLSMKMEGTMNWAQPGKIKKLFQFD